MRFLAIILTGLSLIAPAAHAFTLLNKIGLPKTEYFIVQQIYAGWWIVGLLLPLAFLANIGNAICLNNDSTAMMLSIAAAALVALNLTIFILFTQPANAATQNWTIQPESWETLRAQWEYSHAVNGVVNFLAFCCATLASRDAFVVYWVTRRKEDGPHVGNSDWCTSADLRFAAFVLGSARNAPAQ
jgi:hypothetical protein